LAQSKQTGLAGLIGSGEHNYVKEKKKTEEQSAVLCTRAIQLVAL